MPESPQIPTPEFIEARPKLKSFSNGIRYFAPHVMAFVAVIGMLTAIGLWTKLDDWKPVTHRTFIEHEERDEQRFDLAMKQRSGNLDSSKVIQALVDTTRVIRLDMANMQFEQKMQSAQLNAQSAQIRLLPGEINYHLALPGSRP